MKHVKRIKGKKIYLSPIIEEDFEMYYEWMNNPNVIDNIGRSDKITTFESNKKWMESAISEAKHIFTIVDNNDLAIGCCGINDIDLLHKTCEVYLYIGDESNRGKGYGTEVLILLLKYAFSILNMNNIFIKAFSYNNRAIELYKKIGFKQVGIRRKSHYCNGKYYDIVYMDLLKNEFFEGEIDENNNDFRC